MEKILLEDCCEILDSMRVPITSSDRVEGPYPYYGANGIQDHVAEYIFDDELVLLAEDGGNFGSKERPIAYRVSGKCWVNNHAHVLKPKAGMDVDYLCYSLMFYDVGGMVNGATRQKLTQAAMRQMQIPKRTIEEQKHIVELLGKIVAIKEQRQKELEALDELIKARFVELFGNPVRNSMEWETYQLDECLERIDNGKSFVCSDKPREDNYPAVLKLSAATYGDYRPSENKALLDEKQFVESAEVHAGDLLFTRKNTPVLVGMAAYVQETPSKLMMPDLIFRLVPNEKMNAVFLWQLINCKEFRPVIQAISGGSAKSMSNISKERLGRIKVICPPRELQDSLVPFIKQVDKSKAAVQRALDETKTLFDSLMQKYFG